jgi:hypothetical protein
MKQKIIILFIISVFTFTFIMPSPPITAQEGDGLLLTLEDAVQLGLKNSIALKQVKNEISLSALADKRTKYRRDKLEDGDAAIREGREKLSEAKSYYSQNQAPEDIPITDTPFTIPKGADIDTYVDNLPISEEQKSAIKSNVKNYIEQNITDSEKQLQDSTSIIDSTLAEAGANLSEKLNIDDFGALNVKATGDLMTTMSEVSYEVAKASYDIYRNQIALLIQKSYYDVLKAQKILEVKKKAVQRAEKQYNFAKDSYKNGMKAKDDMLLANVYYKGTQIEYQKAQGELNNALLELKRNLNIPLDTNVQLTDVLTDQIDEQNLEEGLISGLKNRLEIKKASGQVIIYNLNFDILKKKYPPITFQYKEAELLKEKALLNFEKTKLDVESSIRQSYETLKSTEQMLKTSKAMVEQAKESVEIAEYKYNEGFGVETSLLKKLDLESAAGTIVEVLAAQENLANVEEKVVEIIYGYNLAKMKYFNDIGKFVY